MINLKFKFSLLSHSGMLILSRITMAVSGILFWAVASRIYSIEEIGLASSLMSVTSLLVFFSSFGVGSAIVRFLPSSERKGMIMGSLVGFSIVLTLLLLILFVISINYFLPQLSFLKEPMFFMAFVICVVSIHIFQITDPLFIAFKRTDVLLAKNVFQNFVRIAGLLFFVKHGGFGLYGANCIAAFMAIFGSFYFFWYKGSVKAVAPGFDFSLVKELSIFSIANFLNALANNLPGMLFPLIILSYFSKEQAGYFYIPWMMFSVYSGCILAVLQIFMMEVSYGNSLASLRKGVFFLMIAMGLAGWGGFTYFGDNLLWLFKKEMVNNSYDILKILGISILPFALNQLYLQLKNIDNNVKEITGIGFVIIASLLISGFILIREHGPLGIAYAWLLANLAGATVILLRIFILRVKSAPSALRDASETE